MTYTAEINTDGELIGYDPDLSSPHKKKSIHIPKRFKTTGWKFNCCHLCSR